LCAILRLCDVIGWSAKEAAAQPLMRETAALLARELPDARALVLAGATHGLVPEKLVPPLLDHYA
jgi:hypothetical protein